MNTCFGLTLRQFARIAAWHESAFGWLPMPTVHGALELRQAWDQRWHHLPDDTIALLGIQQTEINYPWASRAMMAAATASLGSGLRLVERKAA